MPLLTLADEKGGQFDPHGPYQISNVLADFRSQQVPKVPKGTSWLGKYRFDLTHCTPLVVSQNVLVDTEGCGGVGVAQLSLGNRRARSLEKHAHQGVAKSAKPNPASLPRNPQFIHDRVKNRLYQCRSAVRSS